MNIWTPLNFDYRRRPRGKTNEDGNRFSFTDLPRQCSHPFAVQPAYRSPPFSVFVRGIYERGKEDRTNVLAYWKFPVIGRNWSDYGIADYLVATVRDFSSYYRQANVRANATRICGITRSWLSIILIFDSRSSDHSVRLFLIMSPRII